MSVVAAQPGAIVVGAGLFGQEIMDVGLAGENLTTAVGADSVGVFRIEVHHSGGYSLFVVVLAAGADSGAGNNYQQNHQSRQE
jgi:hypothetical protein